MKNQQIQHAIVRRELLGSLRFPSLNTLRKGILTYGRVVPNSLKAEAKALEIAGLDKQRTRQMIASNMKGSSKIAMQVVKDMGSLAKPYEVQWGYLAPKPFAKCKLKATHQSNYYELSIVSQTYDHQPELDLAKPASAKIGHYGCDIERTIPAHKHHSEVSLDDIKAIYRALKQPFDENEFMFALNTPQFHRHNENKNYAQRRRLTS